MEKLYRAHVLVCAGAGCVPCGCQDVADTLVSEIERLGLSDEVKVVLTGCMGSCNLGPVAAVVPEGVFYERLTPEGARRIAEDHLLKGRVVTDFLHKAGEGDYRRMEDLPFFKLQKKIVLRNCGLIDPGNIEEYIARDGYAALGKVLGGISPQQVIDEVKKSGLRGRGGGGFPTGVKWQFTHDAPGDTKFVLCNADEGLPLRKSHENPAVIALYKEFLGEPLGHKSHELLRTHYTPKSEWPAGIAAEEETEAAKT